MIVGRDQKQMKRVAVEASLSHVKKYLQKQGYVVSELNPQHSNLNDYDAIVVSGLNSNFMGMQDTKTDAVIIQARGLSAEDIYQQIENRFR